MILFALQIASSTIVSHSIQTSLSADRLAENSSNPRVHIESLLQDVSDVWNSHKEDLAEEERKFGSHEHHLICPTDPLHSYSER